MLAGLSEGMGRRVRHGTPPQVGDTGTVLLIEGETAIVRSIDRTTGEDTLQLPYSISELKKI